MLDEAALQRIVADVVGKLRAADASPAPSRPAAPAAAPHVAVPSAPVGRFGVFEDAGKAAAAAAAAQLKLRELGYAGRAKVVDIVKGMCAANAEAWGRMEFEETKIGRLAAKVEKLQIVRLVPGVEWLQPRGYSGDHGITLEESTPIGVIGAITPVTHSVPTLSGNVVNMVAAGNAVVFNPHPSGARCAVAAVRAFNEAIHRELGIEHLLAIIANPSLDSFKALCGAPEVGMLCVTGGPGVVAAALKSGKRAVCAGPGNPPVLVDATCDADKAAADVIRGGSFDNNLLCIGEKEVFVVDKAYDAFMAGLRRHGARVLTAGQTERLAKELFTMKPDAGGCSHPVLNKALVGVDAAVLARVAGADVPADCPMLIAETDASHPLVNEEQMTPVLPVVRVKDVAEGVERSRVAEHGYKHSAIIHSRDVGAMTAMAQTLDTTLLIKNGPCVAGLGLGGEGYLSYSIATTTGEGITTPSTFTRTRRCVMVDHLRIY